MGRTAVYPGSFNPFTIGHLDIVSRALRMFDRIVIAVGYNISKPGAAEGARENIVSLNKLFADEPRIEVIGYSCLTVDIVKKLGACCIVRGVRDVADFESEKKMGDVNRMLGEVETVFLAASPQFSAISSSLVRELRHFGKDVSDFLPTREYINEILKDKNNFR